ncbi:uncharacterized protein [Zea mays]|uniref:uncharacterized protein n=1 Tax=Zea mays TaxID=4577 RepID=UPI0004DEC7F9|nr:uncharacterized protein LOC109943025 [Zea mays]XP_020406247.1 uncharacterized protein LOC103649593 [Zea mays]|eukprot:XP_020401363.1 uncharacterized protein LOC109943025 [Zea mays]
MSPKRVVLAPDLGVRDSVPKEETGGEYKPSASVFPIHHSGAVHRSFDEGSSDYGSIAPHGDAAEGCPTKPSAMPRVVLRSRHALRLPTQRVWFLFLQATARVLPHSAQWEPSWQQTTCDSRLGVDDPQGAANGGG